MHRLLPALQQYLTRELVNAPAQPTLAKPLRQVLIAPDQWIKAYRNSMAFPGAYLWGSEDVLENGVASNSSQQVLRVNIMLYMSSTNPTAALLQQVQGIFPLSNTVITLLKDNKHLTGGTEDPEITGLQLPIRTIDAQDVQGNVLYGVVRVIQLQYWREFIPWHGRQNDESQDYTFGYS